MDSFCTINRNNLIFFLFLKDHTLKPQNKQNGAQALPDLLQLVTATTASTTTRLTRSRRYLPESGGRRRLPPHRSAPTAPSCGTEPRPPRGHRRLPLGPAPRGQSHERARGPPGRALPEALGGGATWRRGPPAERSAGYGLGRRSGARRNEVTGPAWAPRRRRRWHSACSRCRSSSRTRSCPWWPRCAARRRSG